MELLERDPLGFRFRGSRERTTDHLRLVVPHPDKDIPRPVAVIGPGHDRLFHELEQLLPRRILTEIVLPPLLLIVRPHRLTLLLALLVELVLGEADRRQERNPNQNSNGGPPQHRSILCEAVSFTPG